MPLININGNNSTVKNCRFDGWHNVSSFDAIAVPQGSHNFRIQNNYIQGDVTLDVGGSSHSFITDNHFVNCTLTDHGKTNITYQGNGAENSQFSIKYSDFHGNQIEGPSSSTQALYLLDGNSSGNNISTGYTTLSGGTHTGNTFESLVIAQETLVASNVVTGTDATRNTVTIDDAQRTQVINNTINQEETFTGQSVIDVINSNDITIGGNIYTTDPASLFSPVDYGIQIDTLSSNIRVMSDNVFGFVTTQVIRDQNNNSTMPTAREIVFIRENLDATQAGIFEFPMKKSYVHDVRVRLGTAPTGSAVRFDVNKNDSTIFTTQTERPNIATSQQTDSAYPNVHEFNDGDYLSVDLDEVDSNSIAADAVIVVRYVEIE